MSSWGLSAGWPGGWIGGRGRRFGGRWGRISIGVSAGRIGGSLCHSSIGADLRPGALNYQLINGEVLPVADNSWGEPDKRLKPGSPHRKNHLSLLGGIEAR